MREWWSVPEVRGAIIAAGGLIVAFLVSFLFRRVVHVLVRRTRSDLDDQVAAALQTPVFWSVIAAAIAWAGRTVPLVRAAVPLIDGGLKTLLVLLWSVTLARVATLVFHEFAKRGKSESLVQPRTQPLFEIFSKLLVFAGASYAILLSWNINVGAWMASAGIAGIALGFAAKDSLSNLFAGIFIVADAPYSVGDFIVLDGELRGSVTAIGFRSTRLLTLDDIEIIVPNSVIGNAQIVNESGGPYKRARVAIVVECAYGSDSDLVREVMLKSTVGAQYVETEPEPMVRFAKFGGSGLVHELLVWIEHPKFRERVVDDLNRRVYKAFAASDIEIPYSKHDLYIKQIDGLAPLGLRTKG